MDEYQELNAREEQDIEIMMEGCECAISNAEAFAEKLSRELQVLDGVRDLPPSAGSEGCAGGQALPGLQLSASARERFYAGLLCPCKLVSSCLQDEPGARTWPSG